MTTPMTPEIAEEINSKRTPGRFIEDGQIYADTREYKDGLCESGGLVLLEERYGMFAYDGDKELFLNAPAICDAYIAQSDTLWMNQGQIEHLRGRVKEQAKVMQELVACANEMADALKEHHEACLDVGSDTYGHEYSGSYSEEQSRCALLDYGRYKKAGAL